MNLIVLQKYQIKQTHSSALVWDHSREIIFEYLFICPNFVCQDVYEWIYPDRRTTVSALSNIKKCSPEGLGFRLEVE